MGQNQTPKTQQPKSTLDKVGKVAKTGGTIAMVVGGIVELIKVFGKK